MIFDDLEDLKDCIETKEYNVPNAIYEKGTKGIITASGDFKRLSQSFVSISILRDHGCKLPIELFYADDDEMIDNVLVLFKTLNVKCINVQNSETFRNYNARNFSIKSIALYLSSFEEVIWIDSDIIPMLNFDNIFYIDHYKTHNHIFFCDIFSHNRYENAFTKKTKSLFNYFGKDILEGEPETDSGIFVINKRALSNDFILVNLLLNLNHELIYEHAYGDKELYNLSLRICNENYTTIDIYPRCIGTYFENEELFCGNGVLFKLPTNELLCVHMTLHSIDHINDYNGIWSKRLWSHFFDRKIDVALNMVNPINQEIIPKYKYDYKFMLPLNEKMKTIQIKMYSLYKEFCNMVSL